MTTKGRKKELSVEELESKLEEMKENDRKKLALEEEEKRKEDLRKATEEKRKAEEKEKLKSEIHVIKQEISEFFEKMIPQYPYCESKEHLESICTPMKLAEAIAPQISELVYCDKKWFQFNSKTRLWAVSEPTYFVTEFIFDYMESYCGFFRDVCSFKHNTYVKREIAVDKAFAEERDECIKMCKSIQRECDRPGFSGHLLRHLCTLLRDDNFISKLDVCKYQLVFRNGVLNLRTGEFSDHIGPETMVSKCIDLDYKVSSGEELSKISKTIFKICNANKEHQDYYSMAIGTSLTGDASLLKAFFALVGQKGNNGKTTIFDALNVIMPCYVSKVSNKPFYENCNSRHKYLASVKGSRILYIEENVDGNKLDASFIKEFSDGKQINFEVLFSTTTTMEVTGKIFMVSNNTPVFKTDAGLANRYKQMQLNSSFEKEHTKDDYENLRFIRDINLSNSLTNELAMPLINYFVNYSKKFCETKVFPDLPEEWLDISKDTIQSNNLVQTFVEENFEIGQEARLSKKSVEGLLRSNDITEMRFKDYLKMIGIKYEKDKRIDGVKGVYEGIKLKEKKQHESLF